MDNLELQVFPFVLMRSPIQSLKYVYNFKREMSTILQEAIYLSSAEFWRELRKDDFSFKKNKIKESYSKFWLRSSTRCTPYGTFAGCTLINVCDQKTNIILESNDQHIRQIRLDMNYITNLTLAITRIPIVWNQIKFFANNSIYHLHNNIHYVEYTTNNNIRNYQLSSVEKSKYLNAILQKASKGATIQELIAIVTEMEDISNDDVSIFINDLWQSQLLVSELEPCITGAEPLTNLINQLAEFYGIEKLRNHLIKVQNLLECSKYGVESYQEIEKELNLIDLSLENSKNVLQVDLFLSTHKNNIDKSLVNNILNQVSDLFYLSRRSDNNHLNSFKKKFFDKYEHAEMPLNIVLDTDIGIGYGSINAEDSARGSLIDDLGTNPHNIQINKKFDYINQYTLSKYTEFLKNQQPFIEIKEEELNSYKNKIKDLDFSKSIYLMGSLMKKNRKLDQDNFLFFLSSCGGTSAGNLLGRFTQGDSKIFEATKMILHEEELQYPDAILAEIAHLPQARLGNILLRPILRQYEIPYVGKSGIPYENQIFIDDLMVSIRSDQVILRSKKLNKQIIPRLTTAHNFTSKSLPMYKFLCDLQNQNLAYPNIWDWGHLESFRYLPRVVYKNIIIKKARWIFKDTDIIDLPKDPTDYLTYFDNFCKNWKIPKRVVYKENDNELLIDFNEDMGISLFVYYIKKMKTVWIEEFLFNEENCVVKNMEGNPFTNEIIIPISKKESQKNKISFNGKISDISTRRKFSAYSEWLYFKVYCGPKMAETLLLEKLNPFVKEAIRNNVCERFFFIRFNDESHHLRIRFFNSQIEKQLLLQKEFMKIFNPFIDNGLIQKIVIDTYCRELERYDSNMIENVEKLFCNDSMVVLQLISLLEEMNDEVELEKYRLLFALRAIDMILIDFKLNGYEKLELIKKGLAMFFKEFGGRPNLQKQLNEKYRQYQKKIFSNMDESKDKENGIKNAVAVLKNRSKINSPVIEDIFLKLSSNPKEGIFKLLPSYIHMFMNRLFIIQQRKYELIVYHFLDRYYTSQLAIENRKRV